MRKNYMKYSVRERFGVCVTGKVKNENNNIISLTNIFRLACAPAVNDRGLSHRGA